MAESDETPSPTTGVDFMLAVNRLLLIAVATPWLANLVFATDMERPNVDTRDVDGVYASPIETTNGCLMVEVFQGKWHDWFWYYPPDVTNQVVRDGGVGPVDRKDNKVWRWHPRNIYGRWDVDHVGDVSVFWGYQGQARYRKEGIIDPNAVLIRAADAPARDVSKNVPPARPSVKQLTPIKPVIVK